MTHHGCGCRCVGEWMGGASRAMFVKRLRLTHKAHADSSKGTPDEGWLMLCSLYIHQRQASSAILRPSCLQASRIGLLALRLFLSLALCASACASTSQVPLIPSSKASLHLDNNTLFPGPPQQSLPSAPPWKGSICNHR